MTELEASEVVGDSPPPYMIFVVVFLFFLTGLLGFLICHLLKKKGYHCRTGDMDDEEEEGKLGVNTDDDDEENQDTVEQILKCIIENEANMEAFNELLGNQNVCVRHDPRLRKESIGGIPPHHHTVHSGTDHNTCHLCAQVRSKKGRRPSRTPRSKQRPGEQTVFSVGRFRVTHNKKSQGPNPMASSGDQLDQSQDSMEQKDVGYNLKSMFKDAQIPSETSNGVAPVAGKRRKSVTLFGLRRGSDPVGLKAGEGTGRETGGVRFAIQQQPAVPEELSQTDSIGVASERSTKPGIKPETEPSKNQTPASPQREAKTSGSGNSPSSQSKIQAKDSRSVPEDGPSTEPSTNLMVKPSIGSAAASAPSSLPIPSPASTRQTFKTTERQGGVVDKGFKNEDAYDPGPLQTSTPIDPMHRSIPGFTPVIPTDQLEPSPSTGFPVIQTPPDPRSSPDLEPGFGASLALISLGSSPPSSFQGKTQSSVSSLKTPTSPLAVTPSPKLSSRNTPSEATKTGFSPALTPSPKLQSGRVTPSQSPIPSSSFGRSASPLQGRTPSPALTGFPKPDTVPASPQTPSSSPADQTPTFGGSPRLTLKSGSVASVTSVTKGDVVSSPLSLKEQELEGARIPKPEEKAEIKRVGILKTSKLSQLEGDSKASALSSPTDQLSARLSSLPLSPPSPLSPSSPLGSRVSSVTVIKASPDSKREFSVVTMVEDGECSASAKDQKAETSDLRADSKEVGISPAVGQGGKVPVSGVGQPESQSRETSGAEDRPTTSQEKDDMVEMEDIRDCKVTQVEEAETVDEENI